MSWLIPRLNIQQSQNRFADLERHLAGGGSPRDFVAPALSIAAANPNGGRVAPAGLLQEWRHDVMERLRVFEGCPIAERPRFDAETGRALAEVIDPIRSDAAHDGTWAFLQLAVFPDLVLWRWGANGNGSLPASRWIGRFAAEGARDRMHLKTVWRRWQVLGDLMVQEPLLGEDELVQLFERTAVARNPRLVRLCAREVLAHSTGGRMEFARALMKQVSYATGVRLLDVMSDDQLATLVHQLGSRVRDETAPVVSHSPYPEVFPAQLPEPTILAAHGTPVDARGESSPASESTSATLSAIPARFDWSQLLVGDQEPDAPRQTAPSGGTTQSVTAANAVTTDPDRWLPAEVDAVVEVLSESAPHQASTIRFASAHDGRVTREELYALCGFSPDRQLKGFRRPVSRATAALAEKGAIRKGLPELLLPWYESGGVASGYRLALIATPPTG